MLLQSQNIFFKILETLAILLLLIQLFAGITYFRRGHFGHSNILSVTGLLVLFISIFFINFNKINLFWLIPLTWIISIILGQIIVALKYSLLSWIAYPFQLLTTALFKLYTLGVSPRKIWFTQAIDDYEAAMRTFQSEPSSARLDFINFTNFIFGEEFMDAIHNSATPAQPRRQSSFTPNLILLLVGSFEVLYAEPINPSDEMRFRHYVQDLSFSLKSVIREIGFGFLEKHIEVIICNLYFIYLVDMKEKTNFPKNTDSKNMYSIDIENEMLDYFNGRKLAKDWLEDRSSVQSDFSNLFINWSNHIEINPEEALSAKRLRWLTWK